MFKVIVKEQTLSIVLVLIPPHVFCGNGERQNACFSHDWDYIGESLWTPSGSGRDREKIEATGGFEPPHKGFADLSLTTWVRRHHFIN